jgi:hypothetical protein
VTDEDRRLGIYIVGVWGVLRQCACTADQRMQPADTSVIFPRDLIASVSLASPSSRTLAE